MIANNLKLWALGGIVALFGARAPQESAPAGDVILDEALLVDCEINIRPKDRLPATDNRADVYWKEVSEGVIEFRIKVSHDNYFKIGDYSATTTNDRDLTVASDALVTLTFNPTSLTPVSYKVTGVATPITTPIANAHSGSHDTLGLLGTPYTVRVVHPTSGKERGRVLIQYRGLTSGFTLSHY